MEKKKLILISGIPGTGKTTIGNFLEKNYNYKHFDMEKYHRTSRILKNSKDFIEKYFCGMKKIVLTWGFSPDKKNIDVVNYLKENLGFKVFYFDGDRGKAKQAAMKRKGYNERNFERQINSLDRWDLPKKINAKIINVFNKKGNFKPIFEIAKKICAI